MVILKSLSKFIKLHCDPYFDHLSVCFGFCCIICHPQFGDWENKDHLLISGLG